MFSRLGCEQTKVTSARVSCARTLMSTIRKVLKIHQPVVALVVVLLKPTMSENQSSTIRNRENDARPSHMPANGLSFFMVENIPCPI